MANAPITRPKLHQSRGGSFPAQTRSVQGDGSNTFVAQQFVKMSSGSLAAYVADDTGLYGLTPDKSHASTDEAYTAPYAENHNVIDPRSALFIMNISDASGNVGSGTTTQGDVTIGTLYSGVYLAATDTSALAVDASDSGTATKNIFRVEALWPEDATTDKNGRVIVSIIDSAIQ